MAERARYDRRGFLVLTGGAALAAVVAACSDGNGGSSADTSTTSTTSPSTSSTPPADTAGLARLTSADFEGLGTCQVFPESTAGPFPLDEQFDRRDITEGYPGHPVRLGLRVLDDTCAPLAGAAVEVWHTDATGDYSAFTGGGTGKDEAEGTTFLRGTQVADDDGIAEFHTIYPGWYPGRAVHIHLRVHVDGEVVRTGQLYFDDDYTESVFAEGVYAEFGPPAVDNAADGISGDPAADGTMLALTAGPTATGDGTVALLNVGL